MSVAEQEKTSVLGWPELSKSELVQFYNEISRNKVLDIDWKNPGRIDPKLVVEEEKRVMEAEKEQSTANESMIEGDQAEIEQEDKNFDLLDEFSNDMETNANQVLRLTHTKTVKSVGRASVDKVLNNLRKKNFEEEQMMESDQNQPDKATSEPEKPVEPEDTTQ